MTALLEQPRVPAGAPGGGRFAPKACSSAYAVLDALAAEVGTSSRIEVPAPRCPHGHFVRWAARNCTDCDPGVLPTAGGPVRACGEPTSTGEPCTRRTTRRTCHQHA